MQYFHGEVQTLVKVEVSIRAEDLADAQAKLKDLDFDVSPSDDVHVKGWKTEPQRCDLANGIE